MIDFSKFVIESRVDSDSDDDDIDEDDGLTEDSDEDAEQLLGGKTEFASMKKFLHLKESNVDDSDDLEDEEDDVFATTKGYQSLHHLSGRTATTCTTTSTSSTSEHHSSDPKSQSLSSSHNPGVCLGRHPSSQENLTFSMKELFSIVTGSSCIGSDLLLEEVLVAYKFLLSNDKMYKDFPPPPMPSFTSNAFCPLWKETSHLVSSLTSWNPSSFDHLLRLALMWINNFFPDFDSKFDCTRLLLVRLKQLAIQEDPGLLSTSTQSSASLEVLNGSLDEQQQLRQLDDSYVDDEDDEEMPKIESSLDLVSLSLALKSKKRRVKVDYRNVSLKFVDFTSPDFPSTNELTSPEVDEGPTTLKLIYDWKKGYVFVGRNYLSSYDDSNVNYCLSANNIPTSGKASMEESPEPVTRHYHIILREGDILLKLEEDDVDCSVFSASQSKRASLKKSPRPLKDLEMKIRKALTPSPKATPSTTCTLIVRFDPFSYQALVRRKRIRSNGRPSASPFQSPPMDGNLRSKSAIGGLKRLSLSSCSSSCSSSSHSKDGNNTVNVNSLSSIPSLFLASNSRQGTISTTTTTGHSSFPPNANRKSLPSISGQVALHVVNAHSGKEHFLLINEGTTTAREVVMILARDVFLTQNNSSSLVSAVNSSTTHAMSTFDHFKRKASLAALLSTRDSNNCGSPGGKDTSSTSASNSMANGLSSLNFALYELSVTCNGNFTFSSSDPNSSANPSSNNLIVRSRRIADLAVNLWSTCSSNPFSRLLLKQISSSSSGSDEGDAEKRLREELVNEFVRAHKLARKLNPSDLILSPSSTVSSCLGLTQLDPIVVALELTSYAYCLFSSLDPQSLLRHVLETDVTGKQSSTPTTSSTGIQGRSEAILSLWESLTEREMFWAINQILRTDSTVERVKVVKNLIKCALFCLFNLRNFSTAASITCALGHSSITRLRKTLWAPLQKKHKSLLKELEKLNKVLDPSKNMAFYRKMLQECRDLSTSRSDVNLAASLNDVKQDSKRSRNHSVSQTLEHIFNNTTSSHGDNTSKKRESVRSLGSLSGTQVVIPFYPVHKKDFTFLHLTSETFVTKDVVGDGSGIRINWNKIRALVASIKDFIALGTSVVPGTIEQNNFTLPNDTTEEEENELDYILTFSSQPSSSSVFVLRRDRRRYPWSEVSRDDKYTHPLILKENESRDENAPTNSSTTTSTANYSNSLSTNSEDFSKKLHSFLTREKMTRDFLRSHFLSRDSILFNEEILMKRSLDVEPNPVASTSSSIPSYPNTTPNVNTDQQINHEQNKPSSNVTSTSSSTLKKKKDSVSSMTDYPRVGQASKAQGEAPLESLNGNFHGLLSGKSRPFGVTSYDQLNKLLALQSRSAPSSHPSSNRSSGRSSVDSSGLTSTKSSIGNIKTKASCKDIPNDANRRSKDERLAPNALYPVSSSSSSSTVNSLGQPNLPSSHGPIPLVHSSSTSALIPGQHIPGSGHGPPSHTIHHHHHHHHGHHHIHHRRQSRDEVDSAHLNALEKERLRLNRESSSLGPALLYPVAPPPPPIARNRPTSPLAVFRTKTKGSNSRKDPPTARPALTALPSYEETIANLRALRTIGGPPPPPCQPQASSSSSSNLRSRSTSCPRTPTSRARENLV